MSRIKCDKHGVVDGVLVTESILNASFEGRQSGKVYVVQEQMFDDVVNYYYDEKRLKEFGLDVGHVYEDLGDEARSCLKPMCMECFREMKVLPTKLMT